MLEIATNLLPLNVINLIPNFLIAYLGGLFASFTPCVYPMIPITIGVISQSTHKRQGTIFYIAGLTIMYTCIGVIAALSGKIFGSFTNTGNWNLSIGIFLTWMALTMLDVFTLHIPLERVNTLFPKFQSNSIKTFFLGASSGLVAAPCTTPILSAILTTIASSQSLIYGFTLMFAFSLGLSTLLFLIANITGLISHLPKSGVWLKKVKTFGGLLILGFAEYLIFKAGKGF
jgi:thiol:disulfide interchange protein